jgi:outer membrane biogenesis lipoprotein LolB
MRNLYWLAIMVVSILLTSCATTAPSTTNVTPPNTAKKCEHCAKHCKSDKHHKACMKAGKDCECKHHKSAE